MADSRPHANIVTAEQVIAKLFGPMADALARCQWDSLEVGFVMVTPAIAADWLTRNIHNRHLRPQRIEAMAADMASGRWHFDGSPIKFNEDGALVDGQHRLTAVVTSGVAIRFLVVCGLAAPAMDVMDTGAKRTGGDMFELHGRDHRIELAALTRMVIAWNEGRIQTSASQIAGVMSNALLAEAEAADPRIEWAVSTAAHFRSIPTTTTAVGLFLWTVPAEEAGGAEEFLRAIAEHRSTGPGDPILAVIKRLDIGGAHGQDRKRLSSVEGAYVLTKGWLAYRAGRALKFIPLASGHGRPAEFPKLR